MCMADVAGRAIQRAGDVAAVVDAAVAGLHLAGGLVFERGRDALVDDVDQAADRAGAVEQGGGAAQDLDLARDRAFGGHRVVVRQAGHVRGRHAVFQHLDARAFHAADDGARGAGAEGRGGYAQLVLQGLAERAADLVAQFVAGQHLGRGQDLVAFAVAQGTGGDDDLLHLAVVDDLAAVGWGVGEGGGVGEQDRAGEQRRLHLFHGGLTSSVWITARAAGLAIKPAGRLKTGALSGQGWTALLEGAGRQQADAGRGRQAGNGVRELGGDELPDRGRQRERDLGAGGALAALLVQDRLGRLAAAYRHPACWDSDSRTSFQCE
jgi:hypothetical protein